MDVRPTSDRLRETLFNILQMRIVGTRFLDLCAGTGAVGIEALSRGAEFVTFVDRSRKSCALIEANLKLCGVANGGSEVVTGEAAEFVRRAARAGEPQPWDIVYYDPPYSSDYFPVLEAFGSDDARLLAEGGIVIAEHHMRTPLAETVGTLRRWRTTKQGDNSLSFYERG